MVTILILPLNQLRCRLVAGPMEPGYSVKHSSRLECVMNTCWHFPRVLCVTFPASLAAGARVF